MYQDNRPIHLHPRETYHLSMDLVDHAIGDIRDHKTSAPHRPFLLYLAFGACHFRGLRSNLKTPRIPALHIRRCSGNSDRAKSGWRNRDQMAIGAYGVLERPVALDSHTAAGADVGVVVPQRHVLNTAIVPKCDRVGPPAEPHLEWVVNP